MKWGSIYHDHYFRVSSLALNSYALHVTLSQPPQMRPQSSRLTVMRSFPTEFLILPRTSDEGPPIGFIGGRPIAEHIVDQWGRRYVYCGLVPRLASGAFNLKLMKAGEWIVEPGLLYRRDDGKIPRSIDLA